ELMVGRARDEAVFLNARGKAWGKSHEVRPMKEACQLAKIQPAVGFHELRHTYASLLAQSGADLLTISKLLGHADTRITSRHYAHLCDRTLATAVIAHLPGFGHASRRSLSTLSSNQQSWTGIIKGSAETNPLPLTFRGQTDFRQPRRGKVSG